MSIVLPDARLETPELLIPGRKPIGKVVVDRSSPLSHGLVDCLLARGKNYESADDGAVYSTTDPSAFGIATDHHGQSIYPSPIMTRRTYQLSPANSASKFTRPFTGMTVLALVKRLGNAVGNAPIFAWNSALYSPYVAWGLTDRLGTGILRLEYATGNGYGYIEKAGGFTGDYQCIMATFKSGAVRLFSDGAQVQWSSSVSGALVYPSGADAGPSIGNFFNYNDQPRTFNGQIYMCALWERTLSPDEVRNVSHNPYQFLIPA